MFVCNVKWLEGQNVIKRFTLLVSSYEQAREYVDSFCPAEKRLQPDHFGGLSDSLELTEEILDLPVHIVVT